MVKLTIAILCSITLVYAVDTATAPKEPAPEPSPVVSDEARWKCYHRARWVTEKRHTWARDWMFERMYARCMERHDAAEKASTEPS